MLTPEESETLFLSPGTAQSAV